MEITQHSKYTCVFCGKVSLEDFFVKAVSEQKKRESAVGRTLKKKTTCKTASLRCLLYSK